MSDVIPRRPGESWREVVARLARDHGVEREAIDAFDYEIRHGRSQSDAARFVLMVEFEIEVIT